MNRGKSSRLLFAGAALLGALALAHISYVIEGVHFKNRNFDFGQPPARYDIGFDSLGGEIYRPGTTYINTYDYEDWDKQQLREKNEAQRRRLAIERARNLESNGRYAAAIAQYRGNDANGYGDHDYNRLRIEVLTYASRHRDLKGLNSYLKRTYLQQPMGDLSAYGPYLKPFAAYVEATKNWPAKPREAAAKYERIARQYPGSPRREACLIMVARCLLQEDRESPVNVITQDDLYRSFAALKRLLAEYPKSRFRWSALGWLGRIEFLQGRYANAKSIFERQFASASSLHQRMNALDSLSRCAYKENKLEDAAISRLRLWEIAPTALKYNVKSDLKTTMWQMSASQAHRFTTKLLADPRLFPTYLDMRSDVTNATNVQRRNAARLAEAWAARHPTSPKRDYVLARAAEAWYGQKSYKKARALARRVLASRDRDPIAYPLALYIEASAARRAGDLGGAQTALERIIAEFPKSYVVGGARESLALVYERKHDYAKALDQYIKLDYTEDIAYMVDAKMTPEELGSYVTRLPAGKTKEKLRYALAFRYLRRAQYAKAESALAGISRAARLAYLKPKVSWGESAPYYDDPKSLQDPLKTAHELAKLDLALKKPVGYEAKARALFAKAQYFYGHRNLVLYNPSLWVWNRANAFAFSWNHAVAAKDDGTVLDRHHTEHEAMAQALTLCKRVVKDYPKAKVTPKAAMLGIRSAMRLADLNDWWRSSDKGLSMFDESAKLSRFLIKTHPHSPEAEKAREKLSLLKSAKTERAAEILRYHKDRDWPGS